MGRSSHRHRRRDDDDEERRKEKKERSRDDDYCEEESPRRHHHHRSKRDDEEDNKGDRRTRREDRKNKRSSDDDHDDEEDDRKERRKHGEKKVTSRRKRHRRDSNEDRDEKRKRKHDDRKKSDRKKRSKKEELREPKDDKLKLKVDKSKLFSLGDIRGRPPDTLLDEEDYFAYHKHLWLFLYRDCATAFNDLSSEEARSAFRDYAKRYNAGDLECGYYAPNLPVEALEECKTTRHRWGFKISDQEDKSLQVLQEGVHKQTEYQAPSSGGEPAGDIVSRATMPPDSHPAVPPREDDAHRSRGQTPEERHAERAANRRLRDHVQTVAEELTGGRKDGRERAQEKRREVAAKVHGASSREQEADLNDEALYGGDGTEFSRALAASKQRTAANEARKQARVAELQQKEQEKQKAMLDALGLSHKIGQKNQIQPRNAS